MKSLASYGLHFLIMTISIEVSPSWIYCCLSNSYSLLILLYKQLIMRTRSKRLLLSKPISYSPLIVLHNLSISRMRLLLMKLISYSLLILLHKLSISRIRRRRRLLQNQFQLQASLKWLVGDVYRWIGTAFGSLWNRRSLSQRQQCTLLLIPSRLLAVAILTRLFLF